MAAYRKRGETWYLDWSDPHTGQRLRRAIGSEPAVTESDARAALAALEYELTTGNPVLNLGQRTEHLAPRWADFAGRYAAWHAEMYPASHERIKIIIDKHFAAWWGTTPLDRITSHEVESYVGYRAGHVAPSTANKELRTLKAMFAKAVEWKLLPYHPIAHVKSIRELESRPKLFYSADELQSLYASSGKRAAIWKLLANTGLRRSEALNLLWEQVSDNAITVVSSKSTRTKSGRWRHIPLSSGALAALAVLRVDADARVLPHMQPHSLTRAFNRDLAAAQMTGSLHLLRHTFASHLVMAGRPLYEVQRILGHSDLKVTQIYAHLAPGYLQDAVKGINL